MDFQPDLPMGSSTDPQARHPAMAPNMSLLSSWTQVAPLVMPWTTENRPHLVRFGEISGETDSWGIPRPRLFSEKISRPKRKSEFDFNPRPAKLHITEEKMAAQLKNMHISNSYIGGQGFADDMDSSNECLLPTLVLSKEVQSLPTFQEPLLPESLLPRVEKPTRALVLWKPPSGSLTSQLLSSLHNNSEEVDNANNNTSTPDLNAMTSTGVASMSTDMEL